MKKILLAASLLYLQVGMTQETVPANAVPKIVKEHYTPGFGLLGAVNFSKFRVSDNDNFDYSTKLGWGAGMWLELPLSKTVSFEPQVMYNRYAYSSDAATALFKNGSAGFLSVPALLKFHVGKNLAITAGPQFDFLLNTQDDDNNNVKDDLTGTSIAGNVGLELFPRARVTPFGRFIYGFTNMDNTDNPNTVGKIHNQAIQAGLKFRLAGGKHILADSDGDGVTDDKDKCKDVFGLARYDGCPIPDTDSDGFNDEVDKCPTVAGIQRYNGCPIPDTDKDGINDEEDKCPTVAGLAKYGGCPIPDTDGDGVNDEQDKCPREAGPASNNGCPLPVEKDTDGDGVLDKDDRCPTVPGILAMNGCPPIEKFDAHQVTFATGKSVLTTTGKAELDLVVDYMKTHADVQLRLAGYTDNTGTDKINNPLSARRAAAAKAYIVSKGIDAARITTEGFGSANPVEDNKTSAGRAKNRRVEAIVQ